MRFYRDYRFTFGQGSTAKVVRPPISCVFSATKSIKSEANELSIRLCNLNDPPFKRETDKSYTPAKLEVGYQGGLSLIFQGNVTRSRTSRSGADFITEMTVLDGGRALLQGFVSATVKGKSQAVDTLLGTLPGITKGAIAATPDIIRPRVMVGNTAQVLQSVISQDQRFFIDNETAFVLGTYDVREGYAPLVNADTGLLTTPEIDGGEVTFSTIINPSIKLGGLVKLESTMAPDLNDIYKVTALTTSGDTDGGDWNQLIVCIKAPNYEVPR
ncbi:MAG TPA: hypothetical protein PLC97_08790 [Myxococcota bacterium]|nr:hypothetical protein [Myxococcota bacterium]